MPIVKAVQSPERPLFFTTKDRTNSDNDIILYAPTSQNLNSKISEVDPNNLPRKSLEKEQLLSTEFED